MNRLHEVLTLLGRESPAGPPAALKENLLAEFRKVHKVAPMRRRVVTWVMLAAAAVLVMALLLTPRHEPKQVVRTVQPPAPKALVPAVAVVATQVRKPAKRRRIVKAAPPPVEDPAEAATDFFAIPFTEPLRPEERADVYRIEMPRANMAAFGLPVSGGHLDARVTADVLIGEDGVMRAIRLIR